MNDIDPYKHIRALARSIGNRVQPVEVARAPTPLPEADAHAAQPNRDRGISAFAEALRRAREHSGLTQRELGRRAGVPQSHVSKIESGAVDLRLSSLLMLAGVLRLKLVLAPQDDAGAGSDAATPRTPEPAAPLRETARAAIRLEESTAAPALLETGTQ